jgi:long-chain acyl-CoA synthetase
MAYEPRFKNLVSMFKESVSQFGPRPLFGVKKNGQWTWMTYTEFGKVVDDVRGGLAQCGLGVGDRAAIISNNRVEWAASAYATYGLGGSFVPMYEAQQAEEWEFILKDSGSKVAFCATPAIAAEVQRRRGALPDLKKIICLDAPSSDPDSFEALKAAGAKSPVPAITPDTTSLAAFIYTSGTTGKPKGVMLTHSNLASNVSAAGSLLPLEKDDRTLSFLPWAHSFGQTCELHLMISYGVSMGICEGVDKIIPNLAEVQPTVLLAVPRIFNRIYDGVQKQVAGRPAIIQALFHAGMRARSKQKRGESLSLGEMIALPLAQALIFKKVVARFGGRLRFAVSGGAALSREVAEFVDNLGIVVLEGYGLSETSPIATVNTPDARRLGSVGKPIPGVTVRLDHEASGSPDEGEVIIAGHNIMKGYHNLPEDSAKAFTPDGGFRSGDLGKFDKDGFLFITGRIKELYKLENGKYVAPVALEEKLQLSPLISQAMVYGANRPFNIAVIVPDMVNLKEWAQKEGLDASDIPALLKQEKTRALFRSEIESHSGEFKGFEGIKDFVLIAQEFSVNNDMLTPKMSMKRRNILKAYQGDIDALYAGAAVTPRKAASA